MDIVIGAVIDQYSTPSDQSRLKINKYNTNMWKVYLLTHTAPPFLKSQRWFFVQTEKR